MAFFSSSIKAVTRAMFAISYRHLLVITLFVCSVISLHSLLCMCAIIFWSGDEASPNSKAYTNTNHSIQFTNTKTHMWYIQIQNRYAGRIRRDFCSTSSRFKSIASAIYSLLSSLEPRSSLCLSSSAAVQIRSARIAHINIVCPYIRWASYLFICVSRTGSTLTGDTLQSVHLNRNHYIVLLLFIHHKNRSNNVCCKRITRRQEGEVEVPQTSMGCYPTQIIRNIWAKLFIPFNRESGFNTFNNI